MKRLVGLVVALTLVVAGGAAQASTAKAGTLANGTTPSAALGGGPVDYTVYLPYGYGWQRNAHVRYPVLYLLHGRGDTMRAWTRVVSDLDALIADGAIPPVIAVLPDAPWNERGSWYVDSAYAGGKAVETALTRDLVSHVDATYRTAAHRGARLVGGYSMGGYGALRYALAHQDVFANALVLSPAVYAPLPPADSSAREYGGFGSGDQPFVDDVYRRLNYPAVLPALDADRPVHMFIGVGDDEWANPDPADAAHDLDYEAATLYNQVRRSPAVAAQLRVLDGGHDWTVWRPAFVDGLRHLSATLNATPPTGLPAPLRGTAGADWAGGAAPGVLAYSVTGAGLDAVVQTPQWTRQFGTPANDRLYGAVAAPDGGVYVAGYTRGDLDGAHPGSPADDAFVARFTAGGERAWLTQLGDPTKADRFYGLTAAPDGGVYAAGYTSGAFPGAGASAGDKDAVVTRIGPDGTVTWARKLGGAGEDKAYAVAADAQGVYVAGVTSADGTDGFLAKFGVDGTQRWQVAEADLLAGVAVTASGQVVATGVTSTEAGRDAVTVAYGAGGVQKWRTVTGGKGDDAGADVVALPSGDVAVVGFTGSALGVPAGGADGFVQRLSPRGKQQTVHQFGTARADGADPFGEENLYAALVGDHLVVTGRTEGTPTGGAALGNGDVFVIEVTP